MEETLKKCLQIAGIGHLPKPATGAYEGRSILKVEKSGGKEAYCIGVYNTKLERSTVAEDFDIRMVQKVVEAYPFEIKPEVKSELELLQESVAKRGINIEGLDKKKLNAIAKRIEALTAKLSELGMEETSEMTEEQMLDKIAELSK